LTVQVVLIVVCS